MGDNRAAAVAQSSSGNGAGLFPSVNSLGTHLAETLFIAMLVFQNVINTSYRDAKGSGNVADKDSPVSHDHLSDFGDVVFSLGT